MIVFFVAHVKMMTSPDALFICSKFWFSGFLGEGGKEQKMAQNDKKICLTPYLRNCTLYDWFFVHMCKMMIYPAIFFHFLKVVIFWVFQSSSIIPKINSEVYIPHLLHMCVIFYASFMLGILQQTKFNTW